MSVTTRADECRVLARQHIAEALKALNEILVERCWGWDAYTEEYDAVLVKAHKKLMKLRDAL